MININRKEGFTLIELLVVIAIIGILSSVVLASLNTARDKGADAAIKGSIGGVRAQAELVYDSVSPNSYNGVCEDSNVQQAETAADNAGSAVTTCQDGSDVANTWVFMASLKSDANNYYCVDYKGAATTTSGTTPNIATDGDCDSNTTIE
jgi:prepilin-type N-terminal cleavage/methylation domain-containing protein